MYSHSHFAFYDENEQVVEYQSQDVSHHYFLLITGVIMINVTHLISMHILYSITPVMRLGYKLWTRQERFTSMKFQV